MRQKKQRLDVVTVQKGLFESREKAKAQIMAGNVFVNDIMVDKPGTQVKHEDSFALKCKGLAYVSRGGLKLEKALKFFEAHVRDKVAIDAGASTGGFTDCLLQNGVKKVFAVDVGYGQLDYGLRNDVRVVVLERTNVRYLSFKDIGEKVDIITADLSFISLSKVFGPLQSLLKDDGEIIALVKPQFEAGRKDVGKKGVIRDQQIHTATINGVVSKALDHGLFLWDLTFSPIKGPKGNIEFFARFKRHPGVKSVNVEQVVIDAHGELRN